MSSEVRKAQRLLDYIGARLELIYVPFEYGAVVPKKYHRTSMMISPRKSASGKLLIEGRGYGLPDVRLKLPLTKKRAEILLPLLRETASKVAYEIMKENMERAMRDQAAIYVSEMERVA